MSYLPCHSFIAYVHCNVAQVTVFYSSNHPKVDTAYFFEAWSNEERVGVVFLNLYYLGSVLCNTTKDLNRQNYHKYFHLPCNTMKYFAVLQKKKKNHIQLEAGVLSLNPILASWHGKVTKCFFSLVFPSMKLKGCLMLVSPSPLLRFLGEKKTICQAPYARF